MRSPGERDQHSAGVFMVFFVPRYSTPRKIAGWNKCSGSTNMSRPRLVEPLRLFHPTQLVDVRP